MWHDQSSNSLPHLRSVVDLDMLVTCSNAEVCGALSDINGLGYV